MDYKKEYEQLTKFIKDLYPFMSEYCKEKTEEIIPELKNSEDENIRNEIVKFLKEGEPYYCPNTVKRQGWATWLEKQGEQSRYNGEINDEALQRQLQIWFDKGKCSGRDEVIFHPEDFGLQKQCEQKPSTSVTEFDTEVERFCKECFITDDNEKDKVFCIARHFADWQKNRQNPAWSKEDENVLNDCIKCVTVGSKSSAQELGIVGWLKSLKERYSWKPSDEQIEALLKLEEMHVLEHEKNQENAHLYMVVKSIREQLLKLKGK